MTAISFDQAGEGPPVVLLHSFPLDRTMWRDQLRALADARRHAYAIDLPGFGGNPCPSVTPSLDVYADAVDAFFTAHAIPAATVVGLSLGGYVAFNLARRYPQRIKSLVLADTRAAGDTAPVKAGRVVNLGIVKKHGPGAILDRLIDGLVAPGTSPEAKARIRSIAAGQSTEGVSFSLLAMRDRPDATPTLATLGVPTLVLVGEHDTVTPPAEMRAMASAIPNARFEVIAGAGHLSNLEQPAAFNQQLVGFLRAL